MKRPREDAVRLPEKEMLSQPPALLAEVIINETPGGGEQGDLLTQESSLVLLTQQIPGKMNGSCF